jgi:hypothetical protein
MSAEILGLPENHTAFTTKVSSFRSSSPQTPLEQKSVPVFFNRRIGSSRRPEKAVSFYTGKPRITSLLSFPVSLYNKINNNA